MAIKKSGWVTINGVHVFIDNKSGKITQGPAKFIGSTLNDLPSSKSSQNDLKARLQAKHTNSEGKEVKPYTQNESMKDRITSSVKKENIKRTKQAKVNLIDSKNRDLTDSQLKEKRRLIEEEMHDELLQTPSNDTWIVKGIYERAIKNVDTEISYRNRFNSSLNANKNANTGNSTFDKAVNTKAKVAQNPHVRLHTGRVSSKGNLTPKQQALFRQYVGSAGNGMSGNEALKIAISGKTPTTQTSGGAVAPTSSRQSNPARVSNAKTMGEFLRAVYNPQVRTRGRRGNK